MKLVFLYLKLQAFSLQYAFLPLKLQITNYWFQALIFSLTKQLVLVSELTKRLFIYVLTALIFPLYILVCAGERFGRKMGGHPFSGWVNQYPGRFYFLYFFWRSIGLIFMYGYRCETF